MYLMTISYAKQYLIYAAACSGPTPAAPTAHAALTEIRSIFCIGADSQVRADL
jgi:hypothetical protein